MTLTAFHHALQTPPGRFGLRRRQSLDPRDLGDHGLGLFGRTDTCFRTEALCWRVPQELGARFSNPKQTSQLFSTSCSGHRCSRGSRVQQSPVQARLMWKPECRTQTLWIEQSSIGVHVLPAELCSVLMSSVRNHEWDDSG